MHSKQEPASILATFFYFKPSPLWKTVRPYFIHIPRAGLPPDQPTTNEESIPIADVPVTDIRTVEEGLELDKTGFEVLRCDLASHQDEAFYKKEFSRSAYTGALRELLRERLGAERVIMLSGSLRRRDESFPNRTWGTKSAQQPIQGVHVDYTPAWARAMLAHKVGIKEAQQLTNRRVQILNTWQPLFGPIRDWPLAVLDCRTVDTSRDLLVRDAVYPTYSTESFQVFHNSDHRWYYLSDQMPEDMWLFKSYDSEDGVSNLCPHAAFDIPTETEERPRENVDMMWLVIYNSAGG